MSLIHMCGDTSFMCVTHMRHFIHVCDIHVTLHSCVWHTWNESWCTYEWEICATWLTCVCDITHSYVWRHFVYVCDMTHLCVWDTYNEACYTYEWVM